MKKKIVTVLLVLFVAGGFASCVNGPSDSSTKTTETQTETSTQTESTSDTEVQTEKATESETQTVKTAETETQTVKETDPQVPSEYISALKSAETYSEHMHMSKEGIRKQLTSEYGEQFSEEAANYATENLKADWNENALETAKTYSENMHNSRTPR